MSWKINLNNFPLHRQWTLIKEDVSPSSARNLITFASVDHVFV